jgi:hypothetical protein
VIAQGQPAHTAAGWRLASVVIATTTKDISHTAPTKSKQSWTEQSQGGKGAQHSVSRIETARL